MLIFLALILLVTTDSRVFSDRPGARIEFRIATIEETAGDRNLISEALVEGPPGTDFNITLRGERFRMNARFLTDLIGAGTLKVRAKLDTRRLYGFSERSLPLYEEDAQSHAVELGFDEQIVLLPFGRKEGDDRLLIEITPAISDQSIFLPTGKARPLEIKILKQSPGGEISVQAFKKPHNFEVEAALLENGVEVARGTSICLIEEPEKIALQPFSSAGRELLDNPLAVTLTIDGFERGRPADNAYLTFDVYPLDASGQSRREAVATKWGGVASIGSDLTYDLSPHYLSSSGKKYELRFRVRLAPGEMNY
jgi:hypothetical protein